MAWACISTIYSHAKYIFESMVLNRYHCLEVMNKLVTKQITMWTHVQAFIRQYSQPRFSFAWINLKKSLKRLRELSYYQYADNCFVLFLLLLFVHSFISIPSIQHISTFQLQLYLAGDWGWEFMWCVKCDTHTHTIHLHIKRTIPIKRNFFYAFAGT